MSVLPKSQCKVANKLLSLFCQAREQLAAIRGLRDSARGIKGWVGRNVGGAEVRPKAQKCRESYTEGEAYGMAVQPAGSASLETEAEEEGDCGQKPGTHTPYCSPRASSLSDPQETRQRISVSTTGKASHASPEEVPQASSNHACRPVEVSPVSDPGQRCQESGQWKHFLPCGRHPTPRRLPSRWFPIPTAHFQF